MGNIKPIYKNKGDKMDPKNYRPITILSCLEKHFTAVLSERLTKYSDDFFLYQRPSLQTLSNAFSKSIKAQHILFFLFLRISKELKSTNKLSSVE
jgi:hypothetical protein